MLSCLFGKAALAETTENQLVITRFLVDPTCLTSLNAQRKVLVYNLYIYNQTEKTGWLPKIKRKLCSRCICKPWAGRIVDKLDNVWLGFKITTYDCQATKLM